MSMQLSGLMSRRFWSRMGKKRITTKARKARKVPVYRGLETLESRLTPTGPLVSWVLSGTSNTRITGTIFEDYNSNGVKDGGEPGLTGWKVYMDLDKSGSLNTDAVGTMEPSALADVDGKFTFSKLQPSTYRISEVVQPGWTPTTPEFKDLAVTLNTTTQTTFSNFVGGDITGTVWNDLNADGVRAKDAGTGAYTDPGLTGWTVFLDLNTNNKLDATEPQTLTDASGTYLFSNVPPGDYEVTEILPTGWDVSPTFDKKQTATAVELKVATQDFANYSLTNGSLTGTMWNDLNGDGVRATNPLTGAFTEPGLSGWTVFLDLNHNKTLDAAEPTTTTSATGDYTFSSLTAGDYNVTEILPPGWSVAPTFNDSNTVTITSGAASKAPDFANFTVLNGSIRGVVWNDLNRNGVRDATISGVFTDPGLTGWTIYLDLNRNKIHDTGEPTTLTSATGEYTFADLQVGDYDVRESLPTNWEVSLAHNDVNTVTVFSGAESIAPDFANFNLSTVVPGSVSGTAWTDINGNGIREVTEPGTSGRVIFVDLNSNGALDVAEPNATTAADGSYTITGVLPGTVTVVQQAKAGWNATAPTSGLRTLALKNGETATGLDFGSQAIAGSAIHGTVFSDSNKNGTRDAGERGLAGITVYLDLNNNGVLDPTEPQMATSSDLFFTPAIDEAGTYGFTHLAAGTYTVRFVLPATLSATPAAQLSQTVTLAFGEDHTGLNCAAVFRPSEIHGVRYDDKNGNHKQDPGEPGVGGKTIYIDTNRNDSHDPGEPETITGADGSYTFSGLDHGVYVVRDVDGPEYEHTYPTTTGGILWPAGVSNPAIGNVSPTSITTSLAQGQSYLQTVSLTLPNTGQLTNKVDVFLLFDDTGSFVNNSPIVRAAFPTIMSQLQASLPGIDLGFGVGRFEEYANFAFEYATGRPFILNQPIVAASTPGYQTAIQAALNRTTPGYGGDTPETDIEALFQLVTGLGFDGNNNGTVSDSGAAGLVSTQLNPGASGDVPSFASFMADAAGNVMTPAGNLGGGGFRSGALPIILTATDTGFAYQPYGETSITGAGGLSLPLSALTQTSRSTTPFNYGAGIQQTITALNSLGALVIGLGTNPQTNIDPRQSLSSISQLTGAINRSTTTIANGTATPIAPGDPLYFQIASGFAGSVANGVTSAIQNAVTSVAVDIDIIASDPRVHIINHSGVRTGVGAGQTASFDIEFIGDGIPLRFDLQFVRAGTNVVLGSIPVVIGTPIPGDGYEFEDLGEGEIHHGSDFGRRLVTTTTAPTISVTAGTFTFDGLPHAATATATGIGGVTVPGSFAFTYNGLSTIPSAVGVYSVVANFTSTDPSYGNGSGTATLTINAAPIPAKVGSVVINGGDAQRSRVTMMAVTFDQHVTLPTTASSAFQLARHSDGAAVTLSTLVDDSGAGTVVTLAFTGGAVDFGSLQDGRYDLSIFAGSISNANGLLDGNGDGVGGDNYTLIGDPATNKLFRLFGDGNGSGNVDATDFGLFRGAYGTANTIFDFDNGGGVDASDFGNFRQRFGMVI